MKRNSVILKRTVFFILAVAVVIIFVGIRTLSAFTDKEIEKVDQVKKTGSCESCNLRHANLSAANLRNADLRGADLAGANLRGVNLSGADLSGAMLADAILTDASLTNANLTGATLSGPRMPGADFSLAIWVDGGTCGPGSRGRCRK